MNEIKELKETIKNFKRIVFFSGAGISCDSGIPDFRSENGLYKNNLRAEEILSHTFFMNHTDEFYEFYKDKMCYPNALPNFGHQYIVELEKLGKEVTVITQNIDGLHSNAGSKNVLELHGSIHRNYCMDCGKSYTLQEILHMEGIPKCACGGIIKPDVVLYEEPLNEETINKTIEAISNCDVLIILGTSLSVYPAASFIRFFNGQKLVLINKSCTPYDSYADIIINNSISDTFKELIEIEQDL